MLELRRHLHLLPEARQRARRHGIGAEQLNGYLPIKHPVVCAIHDGVATTSDFFGDVIAINEKERRSWRHAMEIPELATDRNALRSSGQAAPDECGEILDHRSGRTMHRARVVSADAARPRSI